MIRLFHRLPSSLFLPSLILLLAPVLAFGHGRRFAYTQQSMVLPSGASELEVWNTFRFSRDYFYRRLDTRLEFEYGVAKDVMTAFYLNHEAKAYDGAQGVPGGTKVTEATAGISNEWKWKFLDPAADLFGFALYAEGTLGLDETALEGKLIIDKQMGPMILACNLVVEREWETEIENETPVTSGVWKPGVDAGVAWFLTQSFSIGAEARALTVVEHGAATHSAVFFGPSLAFSSDKLWLALTFLPQVASLTKTIPGRLDLEEFERYQARLVFSLEL